MPEPASRDSLQPETRWEISALILPGPRPSAGLQEEVPRREPKGSQVSRRLKSDRLVEERVDFYSQMVGRQTGPDWKEANLALQQIMQDYAGVDVRSETLLRAGFKYLTDLKDKAQTRITADHSHTLMRCLEVLDLIQCGEIVFLAALERKETRGMHRRSDFPFTNPLLQDKFLTLWQENGQVKMAWRDKS